MRRCRWLWFPYCTPCNPRLPCSSSTYPSHIPRSCCYWSLPSLRGHNQPSTNCSPWMHRVPPPWCRWMSSFRWRMSSTPHQLCRTGKPLWRRSRSYYSWPYPRRPARIPPRIDYNPMTRRDRPQHYCRWLWSPRRMPCRSSVRSRIHNTRPHTRCKLPLRRHS